MISSKFTILETQETDTSASTTPTTSSTITGSCCFIPSISEQKPHQDTSCSLTTTAASAAAITTVAAIAAASPAAAEMLGGSSTNGSGNPKQEILQQENIKESSGPKPLVSLMEFDSSKENSLKFPTLPVNIPEAFGAPTATEGLAKSVNKTALAPLPQQTTNPPKKSIRKKTFTTHKEAVNKKQESLALSNSRNTERRDLIGNCDSSNSKVSSGNLPNPRNEVPPVLPKLKNADTTVISTQIFQEPPLTISGEKIPDTQSITSNLQTENKVSFDDWVIVNKVSVSVKTHQHSMPVIASENFQETTSTTIGSKTPVTEKFGILTQTDSKESFKDVVKVDSVFTSYKEKEERKDELDGKCDSSILVTSSSVQARKKTMSVTFQDFKDPGLSSPEEIPSPPPEPEEKVTTKVKHIPPKVASPKVPEVQKKDGNISDKPYNSNTKATLAKESDQVSSARTPVRGLSRSLSKTAIPTIAQQEFQASIYKAPEGANIPKVEGARSKKPTLAAQLRKQKEKQKLREKQKHDRINSFDSNWNSHLKPDSKLIAEAGFYFTGLNDCVHCLFCELTLSGWEQCDDPWIRHCQNSPSCTYLLETKGPDWISQNYEVEE